VTYIAKGTVTVTPYNAIIQQVQQKLDGTGAFGGWGWMFVATVITMLVVGYISRYTIDGAGLVGAAVFSFFAMLNNTILVIPGFGELSMISAAVATWIMVIAIYAWRHA
jgi:hypothetical protein